MTDLRSYHVRLVSTARTAMAAMRWTYPQDALVALKRAATEAEAAKPVASGLVLAQLHFNYVVSGDRPSWRPLRAFDDGRQTFIAFPARSEEHTSELQSLMRISYAVFCLNK